MTNKIYYNLIQEVNKQNVIIKEIQMTQKEAFILLKWYRSKDKISTYKLVEVRESILKV